MRTLEAKILDSTHLQLTEPILGRAGHHVEISIRDGDEEGSSSTDAQQSITGDAAPAPSPSGPRRDRELAWRRSHPDALQAYAGEWVILEGEEIVAHGRSPAQLVGQARAQGIRIPYVFYVEELQPDVVNIGL